MRRDYLHFRPRFTLRTLAIAPTLVCAFLGAWEATKKAGPMYQTAPLLYHGTEMGGIESWASPMPLLIVQREFVLTKVEKDLAGNDISASGEFVMTYHLWL